MKKFISTLFVLSILISACGLSPEAIATQTAAAWTPTSPSTPTPAPTATPSAPSYSEVISTYPSDAELNGTVAQVSKVSADGKWTFAGGSQLNSCGANPFPWKCYGAKFTLVGDNITIDGITYPAGTMLTVDKDLNWIQVSSWK
jgi:hypothetical protein